MFKAEYYDLPNGDMPAKMFIDDQEEKMQRKIFGRIDLLEEYGNALREPYSKQLGGGIFELRIDFAGDIARVFFFFFVGKKAILTNGIIKKKDKTPRGALALAKKYKKEYEGRDKK